MPPLEERGSAWLVEVMQNLLRKLAGRRWLMPAWPQPRLAQFRVRAACIVDAEIQ
jgi:hypothetical protein